MSRSPSHRRTPPRPQTRKEKQRSAAKLKIQQQPKAQPERLLEDPEATPDAETDATETAE